MYEIKINPIPMKEGCRNSRGAAIGAELVGISESPLMERLNQLINSAELEIIKVGREIYHTKLQTPAVSINRLCTIISFDIPTKSKSFFRAAFHVFRHFVIRCGFQIGDLSGVDFKILRIIAESAQGIFDQETTYKTVREIQKKQMAYKAALSFVIEVKKDRKAYLSINDYTSGLYHDA